MPAWCRPCAKCPRSRRSWGCRLSVWAVLLVAPLVFRAPEGPAAREARASLRSAPLLEARPYPPAPSTPVTPVADMRLGASSRSPARPCRHPRAPQPGPSPATRPYERE